MGSKDCLYTNHGKKKYNSTLQQLHMLQGLKGNWKFQIFFMSV